KGADAAAAISISRLKRTSSTHSTPPLRSADSHVDQCLVAEFDIRRIDRRYAVQSCHLRNHAAGRGCGDPAAGGVAEARLSPLWLIDHDVDGITRRVDRKCASKR